MKIVYLLGVLMMGLSLSAMAADATPKNTKKTGKLYHVVSLKFKESATPDQIHAVEKAFRELKTKIPGITSLEWGTNVSPEHHDKGFTHCFVLTFKTDKARDEYLVHPAHKAFGQVLGPVMADVMVIDFWAQK
jgi:hypothetical protein